MEKKFNVNIMFFGICFLILLFIYPIYFSVPQPTSTESSIKEKDDSVKLMAKEPQDAETYFKEAQRNIGSNPIAAITLFQRGLMFKPDALEARKQLAMLYEKQNMWDDAILEYEIINKATNTYESYIDLLRVYKKNGALSLASKTAKKAFEKFPQKHELLFIVSETLFELKIYDEALNTILKYIEFKPDDGNALMLLGKIYEKKGQPLQALNSYLLAKKYLKENEELNRAIKNIQTKTIKIQNLIMLIPEGWQAEDKKLISSDGLNSIEISVHSNIDPSSLALNAAKNALSLGFILDKQEFKEMLNKKKEDEKKEDFLFSPVLSIDDFKRMPGSKLANASICKNCPGIGSATTLAIPTKDGKIYLFIFKSQKEEKGEELFNLLVNNFFWFSN